MVPCRWPANRHTQVLVVVVIRKNSWMLTESAASWPWLPPKVVWSCNTWVSLVGICADLPCYAKESYHYMPQLIQTQDIFSGGMHTYIYIYAYWIMYFTCWEDVLFGWPAFNNNDHARLPGFKKEPPRIVGAQPPISPRIRQTTITFNTTVTGQNWAYGECDWVEPKNSSCIAFSTMYLPCLMLHYSMTAFRHASFAVVH